MSKNAVLALSFLLVVSAIIPAQEVTVTGFPLGIGASADSSIFEPFYPQLQELADSLNKYPLAIAVVTGGVDGSSYRQYNDSNNPGLAIGRAQALKNILMDKFNVRANQITFGTNNTNAKGELYRYARVYIDWNLVNISARIDTLEKRPPVESRLVEIKEVGGGFAENMGLHIGAGFTSTPFGGMPVLTGGVTWKRRMFIEAVAGHTFWRNSYNYDGVDLSTIRRLAGGLLLYYPLIEAPVGLVAGWVRTEEVSRKYNEYVKMSEGPVIGLRFTPIDLLSFTIAYNPSKHNLGNQEPAELKNNQFIVSANFHLIFGGGR